MQNAIATLQPNAFETYGSTASGNRIVGRLLKFSKGDYLAGSDGAEVAAGTKFVAVMDQLAIGWIKWQSAVPAEQVMGLVAEGYSPPRRSELGNTDQSDWETDDQGHPKDPWTFSNYLVMVDVKTKEAYTFTTSSRGGLGAIGELCKTYGKHMREAPDQYPVITLDVGSYLHREKAYGRIKFPKFNVSSWTAKAPYLKILESAAGETAAADTPAADPVIEHEKQERAAKAARRGVTLEETFS
jgi:hypothetical protein